jgi:uncharacterized protein (DUF1330 family)
MYRGFEHLINTVIYSVDVNTINPYKSYLTTNNTYLSDYEISFVVYSGNQLDLSGKKKVEQFNLQPGSMYDSHGL